MTKRSIWILLSNLFTMYWIFPRVEALPGVAQSTLWQRLTEAPWAVVALGVLAIGIVLEIAKTKLAAFTNVGYYLIAVITAVVGIVQEPSSQHRLLAMIFYVAPMTAVLLIDVVLYRRERRFSRDTAPMTEVPSR